MIGFGQNWRNNNSRAQTKKRNINVTLQKGKINKYNIRKEYKINNEDLNPSDLKILVDDVSSLSHRYFPKKRGFLYYKGLLFSGAVYEVYDNQSIYKEVNYKNGLKHAFSTSWYSNKQTKSRSYFVNNQVYFSDKEWYKNGQIKSNITALKDGLNRLLTYEVIDDSITYFLVDNYKNKLSTDIYFDSLQLDKYANEEKEKIIQIKNSKLDINNLIGITKYQVERHNILFDSLKVYKRSLDTYVYKNGREKVQEIIEKYNKKGKLRKKKMVIYSGYLERKSRVDNTENNIKQAVESISSNDLKINSHLSKIEQYENELAEISEICDKEKKKPLLALVKLKNNWFENGEMSFRVKVHNGNVQGLREEWYENGQLKYKQKYKNGKLHGLNESWHENGQKKSIEHTKEGYTVGPYFKSWNEDGKLQALRNYTKDGVKHGTFKRWWGSGDSGRPYEEYYYVNGKLHGFSKEWNSDGELIYSYEYADGKNINKENNIDLEGDKTRYNTDDEKKTNQRTQSNSYETPKRTYYHSCESGCVVINQDGTKRLKYKKKCNYCGKTSNTTVNFESSSGTMTSSHYCVPCKKMSKLTLKSSRN